MRSAAKEKIVKKKYSELCEHQLTNHVFRMLMNIHRRDVPGVPPPPPPQKKSGTLDFRYFNIRKCRIFNSSDKTLSSEKNDTKIIEIG